MELFLQILAESWHTLCLSAPYVLFGFFVAGLLKAFISDDFIARHMGKEGGGGLVKAALFGVPVPLCSCGVLPAAAGIRKQGASKGATTAFLISTPETGVDSIAVSWILLDPLMAVLRPLAAFVTALITGQLVRTFDPDTTDDLPDPLLNPTTAKTASASCCSDQCQTTPAENETLLVRFNNGMRFAFGDLFREIVGWFFIGIGLAGLIGVFVSPVLIETWLDNPVLAMLVMLVIATPLYVCATASTPIAAALVLKGLNPGAALVFLLVGPATNMAALSVITRILGKRSMVLYLSGIMVCSFVFGFAVDAIYSVTDLTVGWQLGEVEAGESLYGIFSALVLIVLLWLSYRHHAKGEHCCT